MVNTIAVGTLLDVVSEKVHTLTVKGIAPAFLVVGENTYRMLVVELNDFIKNGRLTLANDGVQALYDLTIVHSSLPNVLEVAGFETLEDQS
jgi:hypothetical protein